MPGRVLVVRSEGTPDADVSAIEKLGFEVVRDAYVRVQACDDPQARTRAEEVLAGLGSARAWLVLASAAGVRALCELVGADRVAEAITRADDLRCAAVGPTSAGALSDLGARNVTTPHRHTATALLDLLSSVDPGHAILPRSAIADSIIPDTLRARGWQVTARVLYGTNPVSTEPASAGSLRRGGFDVLVLRSPSAARAVTTWAGSIPLQTAVVAGGPTTALAAARLGLQVAVVADDATPDAIARAVHAAQSAPKGVHHG